MEGEDRRRRGRGYQEPVAEMLWIIENNNYTDEGVDEDLIEAKDAPDVS